MNNIELLAPAGSMESLHAAVQAGADAVYLGGNKFSARAYASNFDDENMAKAVNYCHLYNVKVYVTINTIMKENELEEALSYAKFLYSIGVDALIIQDVGLAELIQIHLPKFELHASTQMTVHNAEGALLLKKLGFERIVLSRELSLKEIKYISKELNIETEIFIHGALCVCYSGQCLMSSMIGGRSGNRGRCAQPCRLPYTIINRKNSEEKKGYLLSPKDICTIENIKDIIYSGTTSLKIEGRMKRPEYVAGVVQSYRKAIDDILKKDLADGILSSTEDFDIKSEKKKLMQLFNREGFSKAYLFGNVGRDMMAYSFPKNMGLELGKVQKDFIIELKENIALKDGIRSGESGFTVSKIIKDGKEVETAYVGERVKLLPTNYKKGDILYKTSDLELLNKLERFYKNPYERKIDINLLVKFKVNEPIELKIEYKNRSFQVKGEIVQTALKKPLDKERIKESLGKTGDVPFKFSDIEFQAFQQGFLPVSAINEVRRKLIEEIESYVITLRNTEKLKVSESIKNNKEDNIDNKLIKEHNEMPETIIFINDEEQLKAFLEFDFSYVAVNPFGELGFKCLDKLKGRKVFFKLTNIIRSEFEQLCDAIEKEIDNIEGIITANLGLISRFSKKTNIIGDYKLNVFNSKALDFYKSFMNGSCLSSELNRKELKELVKNTQVPVQILIYGKTELMVSEYCAVGSTFGGKTACDNCNRACRKGDFIIKDRKGEEFIIRTDKFCRSYIYNSVPINLIPNFEDLQSIRIKSYRADFIDENYDETKRILNALRHKKWESDFSNFTRGHYKRGVE
ncbi:DUF3656 domain-containing protein [Clostridium sp. DJ247]|uniref:DUF3656 domain-containing U32 family peptidase n=1 Tax=Clostridium sp. DJ247 TaxID=2726188 RepID=UPI0016260AAC|nr:U32 family peptidase [Clostridium sp. DJ247]MBC2580260.1 U32 family peptidase [Clostridium sp. DJ247]